MNRVIFIRAILFQGVATVALLGAASGAALAAPVQPPVADNPPIASSTAANSDGAIIVTARRVGENIQKVPVTITAFSGDALRDKGIVQVTDLQKLTPGVVLSFAGSAYNTNYSIRGQSRSTTGEALPSVVTYVNEVPLITNASSVPTFDLDNIQILKGPQGTLFGRNTTGGAVLVYTKKPTYDFNGYIEGTLGDFNWHGIEAAVNVPLVDQVAAFRIAGRIQKRDGYTRNMTTDEGDFDAVDETSIRASLLLNLAPNLTNLTVYDYSRSKSAGTSATLFLLAPTGPAATKYNCGTSTACDASLALAYAQNNPRRQQIEIGPDGVGQYLEFSNSGVSNTTSLETDFATFKNIFGYRRSHIDFRADLDGSAFPGSDVATVLGRQQVSNELQATGKLFSGRLNWLVGGFYVHDTPRGNLLSGAGSVINPININTVASQAYYSNLSKAVFGDLTYDLSGLIEGLKIEGAYRYTWDKQKLCSTNTSLFNGPYFDVDGCYARATALKLATKSKAPTWNIALNWQATSDIFLYANLRRGYKGGGINQPAFAPAGTPGLVRDLNAYQGFSPEYLTDVELGFKTNWQVGDWRAIFNLAVFHDKYSDIQIPQSVPVNFDGDNNAATDPRNNTLILNTGRGIIKGIEGELTVIPSSRLSVHAGAAYTDAKITRLTLPPLFNGLNAAGTSFFASPKFTFTGNVRWQLPIDAKHGELAISADFYHSSSVTYVTLVSPSYNVTNLRLKWDGVERSNLDLTLFIDNLFDKRYIDASMSTALVSTGYITAHFAPPRIFGARARYSF